MIELLVFLLTLSVLVLIHEAGHYFAARKFNIKVEEFGFGFPPRAWGKKIGETIYSINWLPIGGFVKLYGEDEVGSGKLKLDDSHTKVKDKKRAFFAHSWQERAIVVVAGVVMNILLAIIIFYAYMFVSGFKAELPYLGDFKFFLANQKNELKGIIISQVSDNSPAKTAGLTNCTQDSCLKITKVNGKSFTTSDQFINYINDNKGKEISLSLLEYPSQKTSEVSLTPRANPPQGEGAMGIAFNIEEAVIVSYDTPVQKVFSGAIHPVNVMVYQFDVLGKLISYSFQEKDATALSSAVSGPVGIYNVFGIIGQIPDTKEKILQFLNLAGILSASLAFFNILPIPALDGGRLMFILVEGITKKKVNPKIEAYAHAVGMAVLLTLIALITFKDISQLFK